MRIYFVIICFICSFSASGLASTVNADKTNKPTLSVASVMSSDEFTSTVKTMGTQSKEQISADLKSKLSKKPPIAPQPESTTSSMSRSSTPPTPSDNTAGQQQSGSQQKKPNPSSSSGNGYYSGFESQPSKPANSSSGESNSSGNWNINY